MAAADEAELVHMVATAATIDDCPSAIRYPRGDGVGVTMPEVGVPLEIGKGRIISQGNTVALLSLGTRLAECTKAAETLAAHGISTTVADARFAKPLDRELTLRLAREHELLIPIEYGAIGRFGSQVTQLPSDAGALNGPDLRSATWCYRTSLSITTARRRCMPRPGSTRTASSTKSLVFSERVTHQNCSPPKSSFSQSERETAGKQNR